MILFRLSDFHVPQEYLTNIFIREKLAPIKLNRYGEDLLFFLFYMNGGDVLQLASAAELYVILYALTPTKARCMFVKREFIPERIHQTHTGS